jgi:hypothetical protein
MSVRLRAKCTRLTQGEDQVVVGVTRTGWPSISVESIRHAGLP